jgi:tRNA(Ile)-lysidine synthase TilS/MesJ
LNIKSRFREACAEYGLLEDGDRVLVGLSGGKDSLMLVRLLGEQAKIYKPRIEVIAAYISVSNIGYQADVDYLSAFCAEHGVRFEHVVTSYEEQEPQHRNKNHCFLCARYRRKALLETARRLECNKIAFGHHRDDIVQTLLMNMTLTGNISTMPPKLKLDKMPITIIRPLCLIDEADIRAVAEADGFHKQVKQCPYEHETARNSAAGILKAMEKLNPDVRSSLWAAMENIKTDYLPERIK